MRKKNQEKLTKRNKSVPLIVYNSSRQSSSCLLFDSRQFRPRLVFCLLSELDSRIVGRCCCWFVVHPYWLVLTRTAAHVSQQSQHWRNNDSERDDLNPDIVWVLSVLSRPWRQSSQNGFKSDDETESSYRPEREQIRISMGLYSCRPLFRIQKGCRPWHAWINPHELIVAVNSPHPHLRQTHAFRKKSMDIGVRRIHFVNIMAQCFQLSK